MIRLVINGNPVLVLEPGNFTAMRTGEVYTVDLRQMQVDNADKIIIAFCPDVKWLAAKIKTHFEKNGDTELSGKTLDEWLSEGLRRSERDRAKSRVV